MKHEVTLETIIAATKTLTARNIIKILEETRDRESNSPFTVEEAIAQIKAIYDLP